MMRPYVLRLLIFHLEKKKSRDTKWAADIPQQGVQAARQVEMQATHTSCFSRLTPTGCIDRLNLTGCIYTLGAQAGDTDRSLQLESLGLGCIGEVVT